MPAGEVQQFASAPKAVGQRKKYRSEDDGRNIMHDPRVIRGNTYASFVPPQNDAAEVQKQREAQRRRLMRASQTKKRPGTPEPVGGRKHMDIQTDSYLEELTERDHEFEAETQTDFLLDRPPSPLFMPAKIGYDLATQVEDGDLFDFDREVEPLLEVLVGKTLEQSMMEVLEEEELDSLRKHQEEFERARNAELLEVQRMEAAEKRRQDEMERRMAQQASQREQDLGTMRKVASRAIASAYLGGLRERALAHLSDAGAFSDAWQLAVDSRFMPQLMEAVTRQMASTRRDVQLLGEATRAAVQESTQAHAEALNVERQRISALNEAVRRAREQALEEAEMRRQEQERIQEEQGRMKEWERTQPPEPIDPVVVEVNDEEKTITLDDGQTGITLASPEEWDNLKELIASAAENQQVSCKIETADDGPPQAGNFRLTDKPPLEEGAEGGEGGGEEPAGGDEA